MRKIILLVALILSYFCASAQDYPVYNQYFNNPYLINPAFVGSSGYSEVQVTHRRQWLGWENAPVSTSVNFQHPTKGPVAIGISLSSESSAYLRRSSALATFGYRVMLGEQHFLNFGLSGGVGNYFLDPSILDGGNPNDQVVLSMMSSKYFFDGQFGIGYTYKGLRLGFAIPRLFDSKVFQEAHVKDVKYAQLNYNLISASYKFNFPNSGIAFEPYVIYRMGDNLKQQWEGLGTVYIKNLVWLGGSYRQKYGASAFGGIVIKKFKFGYAYEIPISSVSQYSKGSHEIQLSIRFGKDKSPKPKKRKSIVPDPKTSEVKKETKQTVKKVEEPKVVKPEPKQEAKVEPPVVKEEPPVVQEEKKEVPVAEVKIEEKKSTHPLELKQGNYIVVGVFKYVKNAEGLKKDLKKEGYVAFIGYSSKTSFFYVYLAKHEEIEDAREDRMTWKELFPKAWVMRVE